ncbi:MAG: hypothetical protein EBS21_02310 [Sphingomonadaceae bacterium]|nr:hypothetical protein [Sphingomonadaceae bacterium]
MSQEPTIILRLEAENIKRLKAIRVDPTSRVVRIGGRNGQGKTSLLDCIAMALCGKGAAPSKPVRDGARSGQIILETSELTVTRKFIAGGGTSLEVTNKEGAKFAGPQGVLDKLTTSLAFDPLAFTRADKKAQFKQLQKLLGIDTESIDLEKKAVFEKRTNKNRQVEDARAVIKGLPMTGPERVDVAELVDELSRAEQINNGVAELEREAMEADNQHQVANDCLTRAIAEVTRLESLMIAAKSEVQRCDRLVDLAKNNALTTQERAARAERVDTAAIKARIGAAQETNAAAAAVEERRRKSEELAVLEDDAANMTKHLQELEAKRAALLSDCKMPVPGIGFDTDGVTLNGLPLEQASAAEQLKLGVAVACAMNPSLKVMLIRDGSLLDDDSMAMIEQMAEAHQAQIWIERVGNDGKCTVVIEDGEASNQTGEGPCQPPPEKATGVPVVDVTLKPQPEECLY